MHGAARPPHPAALEPIELLYLPPRQVPTQAAPAAPVPSPSSAARRTRIPAPSPTAAAGEGAVPATAPPIDWAAEQDRVAESKASETWNQLSQHCRDAQALHIYPPECHRYVEPEPWKPEQKHFGLAGPLPYVRVGQCVVGLGFFGCAVGKPAPPDSHVFDGMRDPDRPNSIPENGSYQAPPDAREPLH